MPYIKPPDAHHAGAEHVHKDAMLRVGIFSPWVGNGRALANAIVCRSSNTQNILGASLCNVFCNLDNAYCICTLQHMLVYDTYIRPHILTYHSDNGVLCGTIVKGS